jgi:multidrug efflux pump subunit AcrB
MTTATPGPVPRGPIAWMAQNSVAANLLMFVIVLTGIVGMTRVIQEVFPEFTLDIVTVSMPYPGASPSEVEQGIVLAVEEQVRGLDGVKRVTSTSAEGIGRITVELLLGADPDKALNDVKSAVDRITSFPENAERATVSLSSGRRQVVSLIVSGDQPLPTLHAIAERARTGLLEDPNVTQVEIVGVPPNEVSIEVPREKLEAYGLSLEEIARQIRAASIELPAGEIETKQGELLIRVADRRQRGHEFEDIVIRGTELGYAVRLGDIATVVDGYMDTDLENYFDGERAIRLTAYRVGGETPHGVSGVVRAFADRMRAELPPNVKLHVWADDSEILTSRIDLLVRNARMGLVLVLLVLALFLRLRLALWVSLGIPISFLGAFALMSPFGLSINMITLFALIVTLGMVVDDAIVVGENVYAKMEAGLPRLQAAIEGTREMAVPVTFAVLTTVAAFSPLFFVPGVMGKIFVMIPAVVCTVLLWSLVESFFVLPAHLGHGRDKPPGRAARAIERVQNAVGRGLQHFSNEVYQPFLERVLALRYVTVAAGVAVLAITIGSVVHGLVPFSFFPKLEADQVTASARLPYGAPPELSERVRAELEASARRALAEVGPPEAVRGMFTRMGEGVAGRGPASAGPPVGSHLVTVEVGLVPGEERTFSSAELSAAWTRQMPVVPGVSSLVISHSFGPGAGADVGVQLSHADTNVLARASEELADELRGYDILTNVQNGYAAGKPQLDFRLLPVARSLGLTGTDVARAIRASFFGAEALREQRDRNEVRVMVRLPEAERQSEHDLERLEIRTPAGGHVPLGAVTRFERGRAPTEIQREDGKRIVAVEAELRPGVASPREVLASLSAEILPGLRERYPGLTVSMVGQQREQGEAFQSLGKNFVIALFVIFALLAVPFKSYAQPLIVMSAIPFGFVGAVFGHVVMGYGLSIMSVFGIIALSGVVVNDSLVLIDATNRRCATGQRPHAAIVWGATRRLRPILLTSLTTFFGLAPMISETSIQARFLIPMAISLGCGVLFATGVVLLLVPALYLIVEDARALFAPARARPEAAPAE